MGDRMNESGTLYIVATPIGNLSDMTLRAIETLKNVDIIACEDTRVSGTLLKHFEIKKPLLSLHQHSSDFAIENIIKELSNGKDVAYISDNGTPGISDPGQRLVQSVRLKAQNENLKIKIVPIPGPSALTAAISVSGLIEKEFHFIGFLPKKKGRQTQFKELALSNIPFIFYESAFRIEKTLKDIMEYLGENTQVFIGREMTKMFEEYWGGNIVEVISSFGEHKIKGEFVVIVQSIKPKAVKRDKYAKDSE